MPMRMFMGGTGRTRAYVVVQRFVPVIVAVAMLVCVRRKVCRIPRVGRTVVVRIHGRRVAGGVPLEQDTELRRMDARAHEVVVAKAVAPDA